MLHHFHHKHISSAKINFLQEIKKKKCHTLCTSSSFYSLTLHIKKYSHNIPGRKTGSKSGRQYKRYKQTKPEEIDVITLLTISHTKKKCQKAFTKIIVMIDLIAERPGATPRLIFTN